MRVPASCVPYTYRKSTAEAQGNLPRARHPCTVRIYECHTLGRTGYRGTAGDDAFQSNTIPPQPARVELEGAAPGAAAGAAVGAAAAAPPPSARDTDPSASGTATSDPEKEEEEGVAGPTTATLPAGTCAAEVQLCLQCRVAPQPRLPEAEAEDDDDADDALSVTGDFGLFPFPASSHLAC